MKQAVIDHLVANRAVLAYTLNNTIEESVPDHRVFCETFGISITKVTYNHFKAGNKGPALHSIDAAKFDQFFAFFEGAEQFTPNTYRKVKDNNAWRAVYDCEDHFLWKYMDVKTRSYLFKEETVLPCRRCGIVMPLKIATVDHQMPQAGGGIHAICRVFRGLGLSIGGPRGRKNQKAVSEMADKVGGIANPPVGSATERYSLNAAGATYWSIIRAAKEVKTLETKCMHNALNLRPLCPPCNSALGNHYV